MDPFVSLVGSALKRAMVSQNSTHSVLLIQKIPKTLSIMNLRGAILIRSAPVLIHAQRWFSCNTTGGGSLSIPRESALKKSFGAQHSTQQTILLAQVSPCFFFLWVCFAPPNSQMIIYYFFFQIPFYFFSSPLR